MRVRIGSARRKRRKRVHLRVKGQYGARHRNWRTMKDADMRSLAHAYAGRRQKKRDYRSLWIIRINGALTGKEISYSRFMNGLKKAGVQLNRKALADLAIADPKAFDELVTVAKAAVR